MGPPRTQPCPQSRCVPRTNLPDRAFTPKYPPLPKGSVLVVQSETMVEALDAAAAGAATPDALLVRAPERDHLHRRDLLYLVQAADLLWTNRTSAATW